MAATIHGISSFGSMSHLPKVAWISILAAGAFALPLSPKVSAQTAQIRHLAVTKSGGSVQIEIQTSRRVLPLTQVVTDPDRLVIDFSDAVAAPDLRAVNVATGAVKAVRVGRVTANPPITRIVVDLNSAQEFQVFPSSKSVVIRIGDGGDTAVASAFPLKKREIVVKSAPGSAPAEAAPSTSTPAPAAEAPAAVASGPAAEPASATPTAVSSAAPGTMPAVAAAPAAPTPSPTVGSAFLARSPAPTEPSKPVMAASTPSGPATSISVSVPATTPAMAPAVSTGTTPTAMTPAVAPATAPPAMTPAVAAAPPTPALSAAPAAVHLASAALVPSTSTPPVAVRTLSVTPAPTPTPAVTISRVPVASGPSVEIQHVSVLKAAGATEIEIATSQRITPEVQVITGPDRLVLDFPQSLPGPRLRAVAVNQGEVKGVRVGLLTAKPPVTRVVLDLKSPQAYQLFPSGRSVIVKLPDGAGATATTMPAGNNAPPAATSVPAAQLPTPAPPPKKVQINVQGDLLSLTSNKGSLAEVLNELQRLTGASVVVPPGAEQEEVAVSLGPASPREVISQLLNGSRYNFIIVGADNDANKVARLILTPKSPGGVTAEIQTNRSEAVPVAQVQAPDGSNNPPPAPPPPPDEVQPQGDSNPPPDTTPQPGDPQPAPN